MARPQQSQNEPGDGPTAVRMLIGAQLRRLREEHGISRAEAGAPIRASESKISRMELGRVSFKERDVSDLLARYGVSAEEREAVLARVREANALGWWHTYNDVMPNWFHRYLGLEATATLIRTYEVQFVPGLLQIEGYARAVVRLGHASASDAAVERRVQLRMERKQVLHRPDPPQLWAVVDEAALRRPVGGVQVMRDQLEALISLVTKARNIRLQVVPLAAGGHAAAGGSFTILRFPEEKLPDVVYLEQLTNAQYLDKRPDIERYAEVVHSLYVEAAPPSETTTILEQVLRDLAAEP